MIVSFGDAGTADLYNGIHSARARAFPADLRKGVLRKLAVLNAAIRLEVLAAVPGNRLEPLKGDRAGFHSLRINDKWRIVFRWQSAGPARLPEAS